MTADRPRSRWHKWRWALYLPLLVIVVPIALLKAWHAVLPSATVHYAKEGTGEIHYVWNVQDRIYRGRLRPGHATSDDGFLFPDSNFFMELIWWKDGERSHCVGFTPKWPSTDLYLDADGNIDRRKGSGTHKDGWHRCTWDWADP